MVDTSASLSCMLSSPRSDSTDRAHAGSGAGRRLRGLLPGTGAGDVVGGKDKINRSLAPCDKLWVARSRPPSCHSPQAFAHGTAGTRDERCRRRPLTRVSLPLGGSILIAVWRNNTRLPAVLHGLPAKPGCSGATKDLWRRHPRRARHWAMASSTGIPPHI